MAVSNNQLTRIGASTSGIGIKLTIIAKEAGAVIEILPFLYMDVTVHEDDLTIEV